MFANENGFRALDVFSPKSQHRRVNHDALTISVSSRIRIDAIRPSDRFRYVELLKDKEISDHTLHIPFPYTEKDADSWIARVTAQTEEKGHPTNWAIRDAEGLLIGGMGLVDFEAGSHRVEFGYWLGKAYWNQGIMTEAVGALSDYLHARFGIVRITAEVFSFNGRSARVLEKAGFTLEGTLKKRYSKDGKIFDGKLYARVWS